MERDEELGKDLKWALRVAASVTQICLSIKASGHHAGRILPPISPPPQQCRGGWALLKRKEKKMKKYKVQIKEDT